MKKFLLLFLILVVGATSCSSVQISSDEWKIQSSSHSSSGNTIKVPVNWNVMKIANYTSADIEYSEKTDGEVIVKGPSDVIDKINIEEKGVTLTIRVKSDVGSVDLSGVKIKVCLPELNEVTLYGSGDFRAERMLAASLELNILGSGDIIAGTMDCTSMKLSIRGSGDVTVEKILGTTIQFLTQGSGDISVKKIDATRMTTQVQGSGDVRVDRLTCARAEALVQGSGDVSYHGLDATTLQATVQGSGDIEADGKVLSATLVTQGTGSIKARKLKCDGVSKNKQGTGDIII